MVAAGKARDDTMGETESVTRTATDTKIGTEMRALVTNDCSDPAQMCKIIRIENCGTGDAT